MWSIQHISKHALSYRCSNWSLVSPHTLTSDRTLQVIEIDREKLNIGHS